MHCVGEGHAASRRQSCPLPMRTVLSCDDWKTEVLVVVCGPGQGVERQHHPADDVKVHLYVEAVVEERELLGPPGPQRRGGILWV